MRFYGTCVFLLAVFFISCTENRTAQIWTDRPEFALYGEFFNNIQSQYKVTVRYVEFPAEELGKSKGPDIAAGSWLKNASTGTYFKSLNNLFGFKKLPRNVFYQRLLAAGRIDRNQFLLPVSFNIPALIFSRDREQELSNQFTVDFDEIKNLSRSYNASSRGAYTRMGFSPLWNEDFLLTSAFLSGAAFSEADPLYWDNEALEKSMDFIYNWTREINTSSQAVEDFKFKYFFEPPDVLIKSGRILFSYIKSSDLFYLSEDRRNYLDFRWIMEQNMIPVTEDLVYLGIPKRAKSRKAARAFVLWFFRPENQRLLLEYSRANRINENTFGICGGFSALSSVTEQIYPLFYPELLGRMPPSEYFTPQSLLPGRWAAIKERLILPYLGERARRERADEIYPLERRLADWIKVNK